MSASGPAAALVSSRRGWVQLGALLMKIETERLTIRSFRKSDMPAYAAIVADAKVTKFLGDGSPHSYEQATAYILDCISSEAEEVLARYAVILKEKGELIGFCGFKKESEYVDLGWRYAKRVWGKRIRNRSSGCSTRLWPLDIETLWHCRRVRG